MDNSLEQGVKEYRAGKRDEARKIFIAAVKQNQDDERDRKSTRLNSSHIQKSRMPSSA